MDLVTALMRAQTIYATPEDCDLVDHIDSCSFHSPLACKLCSMAGKAADHMMVCRRSTCLECAVGRFFQVLDKEQLSVDLHEYFYDTYVRLNDSGLKSEDDAWVQKLHTRYKIAAGKVFHIWVKTCVW